MVAKNMDPIDPWSAKVSIRSFDIPESEDNETIDNLSNN